MDNNNGKVAGGGQAQGAQMIYLAQLNAAKGTCKCAACALLRKGNDLMTADALNPSAGQAGALREALQSATGMESDTGETVSV